MEFALKLHILLKPDRDPQGFISSTWFHDLSLSLREDRQKLMLHWRVSPSCVQLALLYAIFYWPPTMALSCSVKKLVSHATPVWKMLLYESYKLLHL